MLTPMEFSGKVMWLAMKWAFSTTSWGRTPKHNTIVGGVESSYHMLWVGCDVIFDDDWDDTAKKYGPTKKRMSFERDCAEVGLQALLEGDHYHLQPK